MAKSLRSKKLVDCVSFFYHFSDIFDRNYIQMIYVILFSLFIINFLSYMKHSKVILFADDFKQPYTFSYHHIINKLNIDHNYCTNLNRFINLTVEEIYKCIRYIYEFAIKFEKIFILFLDLERMSRT